MNQKLQICNLSPSLPKDAVTNIPENVLRAAVRTDLDVTQIE